MDKPASCRVCGCTDEDCSGCVERTGEPCYWIEPDLCSACAERAPSADEAGDEAFLLELDRRHRVMVRMRPGEPLVEITHSAFTRQKVDDGDYPHSAVFFAHWSRPAERTLNVRHKRAALRCVVGDVVKDFASIQAMPERCVFGAADSEEDVLV